ncbi:uncharacterized protein [Nicotiana tomentosiformis]|uniref:uncharacterized protein n=1 Tax=Nicotiana tomentosiformis TaxID=4098 RepID=UPI00388C5108
MVDFDVIMGMDWLASCYANVDCRTKMELKNRLTYVPVLTLPEGIEGYVKELNLRQRRWLDLLKYYDVEILYLPDKANVVVDVLSRKSMGSLVHIEAGRQELTKELHQLANMRIRLLNSDDRGVDVQNTVESSLVAKVKAHQYEYLTLLRLIEVIRQRKITAFEIERDGALRYQGRLCVTNVEGLREKNMNEIHQS